MGIRVNVMMMATIPKKKAMRIQGLWLQLDDGLHFQSPFSVCVVKSSYFLAVNFVEGENVTLMYNYKNGLVSLQFPFYICYSWKIKDNPSTLLSRTVAYRETENS